MQITIPDNAASLLLERADKAGFASVDDYVLSIVLPTPKREEPSPEPLPPETLENGRSFYDALEENGFIGKYSDYPADLSSNPKHMEGFGQ